MIEAKIIADSISNGIRLTTMQLRFHRFILPEINTHRMFSRNFSSSRAIPVSNMIEQVQNDPAMPVYWGKNKAGMQADEEITNKSNALSTWLDSASTSIHHAKNLIHHNVHKQIANRIIEPFQWVNGVVTATEWDNFFALRDHPAAQPEIQELARKMKQAMDESKPIELKPGEWHLPYWSWKDSFAGQADMSIPIKCSAARCARVSYNKHDGTTPSIDDDLELYNQLVTRPYTDKRGFVYTADDPIHASPCEHQATPMPEVNSIINPFWLSEYKGITHQHRDGSYWSGNFRGWLQARQLL